MPVPAEIDETETFGKLGRIFFKRRGRPKSKDDMRSSCPGRAGRRSMDLVMLPSEHRWLVSSWRGIPIFPGGVRIARRGIVRRVANRSIS